MTAKTTSTMGSLLLKVVHQPQPPKPKPLRFEALKPKPLNPIVPLKQIEYGVYGDLVIMYPKPYSI